MTSAIAQKRKNVFIKDLSSGSQNSDEFLLVPTGGFILSTLYPNERLIMS